MMRKYKTISMATTGAGYQIKVWVDRRDNTALPTHWKQQALVLANLGKLSARDGKVVARA